MSFSVDGWDPTYGTSLELEEDLGESSAEVDIGIEVPPNRWRPISAAYAAPEPAGFKDVRVRPAAAAYRADLGEFILPYDAVATAPSPEAALTEFLESTYRAAADLARWNRGDLERR